MTDCIACHTAPEGKLFAGGLPMPTPFGTLYTSNITPDRETGIGTWTADQFYAMLHTGRFPDGGLLYSVILGFMVFPLVQPNARASSLWDAICSAAGVVRAPTSEKPIEPQFIVSPAVLTSDMLRGADAESIGRGATLAHQCAICHGPTGVSRADSPNLAGQYPSVIYKELKDFQTGARVNAVMSPFALGLSEQDMIDLASYYAYLPRLPAYHPAAPLPLPRIVINGAPLRGVAPCGSCHGALDNKVGSPWLEGQSAVYVKSQLEAFASNERRNDISQQMRNIARQMTPDEIEEAAQYYASQPYPDVRSEAH